MQLHEQYRPTTWDDVAGHSDIKSRIQFLKRRGLGGRAYWFSGPSGTGKTTLARLVAQDVADQWGIEEHDAKETTALSIRETERRLATFAIGAKPGRAVIFNEAQALSVGCVKQLLVTLERIPEHACWVFTSMHTNDGLFGIDVKGHPLLSRCQVFDLELHARTLKSFARRLKECAGREQLDGQPLEVYVSLLEECGGNMREAFQRIEGGLFTRTRKRGS